MSDVKISIIIGVLNKFLLGPKRLNDLLCRCSGQMFIWFVIGLQILNIFIFKINIIDTACVACATFACAWGSFFCACTAHATRTGTFVDGKSTSFCCAGYAQFRRTYVGSEWNLAGSWNAPKIVETSFANVISESKQAGWCHRCSTFLALFVSLLAWLMRQECHWVGHNVSFQSHH